MLIETSNEKALSNYNHNYQLVRQHVAGPKKYQRPLVKTPDTFRGADSTSDQTSIGDLKWFEVFKDEELQKLVRTAMVQNYDLRAAVARINAARANLGLARSDQFHSLRPVLISLPHGSPKTARGVSPVGWSNA